MRRRGFLRLIGGAAAAGPSIAQQEMQALSMGAPVHGIGGDPYDGTVAGPVSASSPKESIAKILGKSAQQIQSEKRTHYINHIEPNAAALRSVNFQTKIKLSREMAWERSQRANVHYFQGIIKGWWS